LRELYDHQVVRVDGPQVISSIFIGREPVAHITADDWERAAEETLGAEAFGYIAGGAGAERTMAANREAFDRYRIKPRLLTGNVERDISVDVLGTRSAAPFLLAPVGVLTIAHEEGELAAARAAGASGIPFILSNASSSSLEEVADAMGDAARWFQLYWVNDPELVSSFVGRAAAAGYSAIVVTLDTLTLGWRPRDLRLADLPFLTGQGCAQFFSDPVFRAKLDETPEDNPLAAAAMMLATFPNLGLTWDDLASLRERTDLPLLVKGVLSAEDARRARALGVDGVIVSNHGGRQVDGAVAALDALVEVRKELPNDVVLMDSGIRTGADVLKALALGANAVLLGRPYAYALAVAGQQGVEAVIRNLAAEIDVTLALAGGKSVRDLDRDFLA